jgi:putative ABC transport system ATP-binding protein
VVRQVENALPGHGDFVGTLDDTLLGIPAMRGTVGAYFHNSAGHRQRLQRPGDHADGVVPDRRLHFGWNDDRVARGAHGTDDVEVEMIGQSLSDQQQVDAIGKIANEFVRKRPVDAPDMPAADDVDADTNAARANDEATVVELDQLDVGFIFQFYNLIPVLSALENVELPLLLTNLGKAQRRERALTALKVVGLADRSGHYPRQLSGGQEQRVAIARAIVADPSVLVADEPTGDLDSKSAEDILALLETLNRDFSKTIVMVTHDPRAAQRAHVQRHLEKGVLLVGTPALAAH